MILDRMIGRDFLLGWFDSVHGTDADWPECDRMILDRMIKRGLFGEWFSRVHSRGLTFQSLAK